MHPDALDRIAGDSTSWEGEVLSELAKDGQLSAYQHKGFWQPMDTLREKNHLNDLWESGKAPGGPKSLRKPKLPPRPKAMASQKTKGQQLKERAMKMKADREKPRSQRGY